MQLRAFAPRRALWVAAFVLALPLAVRAETILNFDDLDLANGTPIPGDYMSRAAGTPNIVVGYRTFDPDDNSTVADFLDFWNDDYGDLSKVAYPVGNGLAGEISFTPDAGVGVTLSSFDMAGWPNTDRVEQFIRIVDAAGNLLLSLGSDVVIEGDAGHTTFTPNFSHEGAIRLQFGVDWNVGIDNIRFSQFTPSAVPEPGTLATAALGGIALVGYQVRRRRRAS